MYMGSECRNPISLRDVLPEAELVGAEDVLATSFAQDSRRIKRGDVFVAVCGSVNDGHHFAGEAVARGAVAVLAERPLAELSVPVCYVPDTREAFGRVCQASEGNPSQRVKVIGVTGTNGKTTTCWLIANLLAAAGYRPAHIGTLGCFDGLDWTETDLTTPPADELAKWLARSVENECTHAVMEVSSHALDQSRIAGISLDAACVTNVRRDHLDYHQSLREYRLTKTRLLDHLTGEGFAVWNADDATCSSLLAGIGTPALTVGIQSAAEITGTLLEQFLSEQTFLLTAGSETVPVRTRMIGTHHAYNCLIAAAVGLAYGIELTTVVRGLEGIEEIPGRLQRIECGHPFGVFVDYAHTPDALSECLQTLREVSQRRLICVFGAGGDRDCQKRPLMGRAVEDHADLAVITTDNPRTEDPRRIEADILRGFRHPKPVRIISDRMEAIAWALSRAEPGDCVLIAGKGHEKHLIIGNQRYDFDDCEVARAWLYEHEPAGFPMVGSS
jgi:UDP-N-acetylmuramoyl-L-alanyl-D-glutamate--2,6-diaminopimelate ligase